jgi:hypothetical protein
MDLACTGGRLGFGVFHFKTHHTQFGPGLFSVVAKIIDTSIYLTIHSDVAGVTKSARCPAAALGIIPSGAYKGFYKGPQDAPVLLRLVHVGL